VVFWVFCGFGVVCVVVGVNFAWAVSGRQERRSLLKLALRASLGSAEQQIYTVRMNVTMLNVFNDGDRPKSETGM